MKIIESQAVVREAVDVRCIDQGAEAADLCETDIIQQEDDDIGRIRVRQFFLSPPFLGVLVTLGNHAAEAFDIFRFYT